MTIKECIDIVDNLKPNQYGIEDKVAWLSYIDHSIINEVLLTHEGYDGRYDDFTGYSADKLNMGLIVPSPYDRLYPAYLKMKIDEENGETARYNNSVTMFNAYLMEYKKWYNKMHMPLSATGRQIRTKKPETIDLSDAQMEQLKKVLYADLNDDMAKMLSDDKIYDIVMKYVNNNVQMLKGKDGRDGVDGKDGSNGKDGLDGTNGIGILGAEVTVNGELKVTLTSGVVINLGVVKGEKGDKGDRGMEGAKGDKGDRGAKGDKGDQGERGLTGPQGIQGVKGDKGDKGEKGDAFTYNDFTQEQLDALKVKGDKGDDGKSAFEYAQEGGYTGTEEQFAQLMASSRNVDEDELLKFAIIKPTTEKTIYNHLTDSADYRILSLEAGGSTKQEGIPTPLQEQEIINAGTLNKETGKYEVELKFSNKNLFDKEYARDNSNWIRPEGTTYGSIPIRVTPDVPITISWEGEWIVSNGVYALIGDTINSTNTNYKWLHHAGADQEHLFNNNFTITPLSDTIYVSCLYAGYRQETVDMFMNHIGETLQIEYASEKTEYKAHQGQTVTITSDRPITKWDSLVERDGVIGWLYKGLRLTYDGNETWDIYDNSEWFGFYLYNTLPYNMERRECFSNLCVYAGDKDVNNSIWLGVSNKSIYCVRNDLYDETLEDKGLANWKTHLTEKPLEIWTYSDTEEFVPLSEEEQDALRSLATYYPTTVIFCDQEMSMKVQYVADTKNYIDGKSTPETTVDLSKYAKSEDIPSKTSQLTNDSGFATQDYVEREIAKFDFIKVVSSLPEEGLPNRIYLVMKKLPEGDVNFFDEYIWVNYDWEYIGTKEISVDLTEYVTIEYLDELLQDLATQGYVDNKVKNLATEQFVRGEVAGANAYTDDLRTYVDELFMNGEDGVGIQSVVQTATSDADDGENIITVTLTNGQSTTFTVKNGSKGDTGEQGPAGADGKNGSDATVTTDNITKALGYTPANQEKVSQLSDEKVDYSVLFDYAQSNYADMSTLKTGMIHTNGTVYTGGSYDAYYYLENYIPVTKDEVISLHWTDSSGNRCWSISGNNDKGQLPRIVAYDESKGVISELGVANNVSSDLVYSYTVPSGVAFIRVTLYKTLVDSVTDISIVKNATAPVPYAEYGKGTISTIKKQYIPNYSDETVNGVGALYVSMPDYVNVLVGNELKIYYRNIISRKDALLWVGYHNSLTTRYYDEYITITATADGTHSLPWKIYDAGHNLLDAGTLEIIAVTKVPSDVTTAIVIGDSTVNAGVMTAKAIDLYTSNSATLSLLGTRGSGTHEGRGGWTAEMYCTVASNGGIDNPFYNNGFDFSYYMANQNYSGVQAVVIQLGINDIFAFKDYSWALYDSTAVLGYINQMVQSIRAYNSNIKVIINLPITPNSNGTSFTETYGTTQLYWIYNENIIRFAEELKDYYADNSSVTISASNCILDTKTQIRDGVHPTDDGYNALGQRLYEVLVSIIDGEEVIIPLLDILTRTRVSTETTVSPTSEHELDNAKCYEGNFSGTRSQDISSKFTSYNAISSDSFSIQVTSASGYGMEFPVTLESGKTYTLKYTVDNTGRVYVTRYNSDTTYKDNTMLSSTAGTYTKTITPEEGYIYGIIFVPMVKDTLVTFSGISLEAT